MVRKTLICFPDLTRFVDPPLNVVETHARDDIAQPFTPAPSRDSANVASPNSTVSGISTATVDPFKSLALRRMSGSTLYTMGPTKPISDPMTARLLQHYIDNLASWVGMPLNYDQANIWIA